MPLMKLHKNRVFASTLGHAVRFVKDEPVFVPPIMERVCEAIGAVFVTEDNEVIETIDKEEEMASGLTASINAAKKQEGILPEKPATQPVIPADRIGAILKAIHLVTDRNVRGDFTAGGRVNLKVLSKEVGFRVDKSELTEAMEIINDPD
jgi:hypothetical protein